MVTKKTPTELKITRLKKRIAVAADLYQQLTAELRSLKITDSQTMVKQNTERVAAIRQKLMS